MITPLTGALVTGGLSLFQGMLGYNARRQDYLNQVAYKKASDKFASWQAGMQAKQSNLNNQYQYWAQTVNHGQELAYVNQMRNWELSKSIISAEEVARARSSSMAEYATNSQAIAEGLAQQAAADAISMMQYKQQAMKMMASAQGLQEGASSERIINDYARQLGDMQAMQAINEGFRNNQYSREQAGLIANYLNQYNSQQLYQQQEFQDPIPPFAPLPTLVGPAGPSMVGAAPSATSAFIGAGLGAIQTGLGTYSTLKSYTSSGKRS